MAWNNTLVCNRRLLHRQQAFGVSKHAAATLASDLPATLSKHALEAKRSAQSLQNCVQVPS